MDKALATILTPSMNDDDAFAFLLPAANSGSFVGLGIKTGDELTAARDELIAGVQLTKDKASAESFFTKVWEVEAVDGVDAIDAVDEVRDPISDSILVKAVEAVDAVHAVHGVKSTLRSLSDKTVDHINESFLPSVSIDNAKKIAFTVEYSIAEDSDRYTAKPSLLTGTNKPANGSNGKHSNGSNGGNGGNGKASWKVNSWLDMNPNTSTTKPRILKNLCLNAGVDVSDLPAKVEDEHTDILWNRCKDGYNLTGDPSDYTNKGLMNHYLLIRDGDDRPVFSE